MVDQKMKNSIQSNWIGSRLNKRARQKLLSLSLRLRPFEFSSTSQTGQSKWRNRPVSDSCRPFPPSLINQVESIEWKSTKNKVHSSVWPYRSKNITVVQQQVVETTTILLLYYYYYKYDTSTFYNSRPAQEPRSGRFNSFSYSFLVKAKFFFFSSIIHFFIFLFKERF